MGNENCSAFWMNRWHVLLNKWRLNKCRVYSYNLLQYVWKSLQFPLLRGTHCYISHRFFSLQLSTIYIYIYICVWGNIHTMICSWGHKILQQKTMKGQVMRIVPIRSIYIAFCTNIYRTKCCKACLWNNIYNVNWKPALWQNIISFEFQLKWWNMIQLYLWCNMVARYSVVQSMTWLVHRKIDCHFKNILNRVVN